MKSRNDAWSRGRTRLSTRGVMVSGVVVVATLTAIAVSGPTADPGRVDPDAGSLRSTARVLQSETVNTTPLGRDNRSHTRVEPSDVADDPVARDGSSNPGGTVHPHVYRLLADRAGAPVKVWIRLREKDTPAADTARAFGAADAPADAIAHLSPRALQRRTLRRTAPGIVDARDLPVSPAALAALRAVGVEPVHVSRWLNAASAWVDAQALEQVRRLPFVESIELVRRSVPLEFANAGGLGTGTGDPNPPVCPWGIANDQLSQAGIAALHEAGLSGAGVIIGVLDTGFATTHEVFNHPDQPINVIAAWDFVGDDPIVGYEPGDEFQGPGGTVYPHSHGTRVLSTIAGFNPCAFMGGAYGASFVLARTEDSSQEVPAEEDAYVAGLEFIEANGADVATSSLGYTAWYDWEDMDGLTAVTTVAVNIATENGLVCVTAVGNGGHNGSEPALVAPSDAFDVIAVGAVNKNGQLANFSANGPSADGRVKPEVLAMGVAVWSADPINDTEYDPVNGTSFATPLVASAVALLLEAHPEWTVADVRTALFETASVYVATGAPDPLFLEGYGIINAAAAAMSLTRSAADLDGDGIVSGADLGILLGAWGPCSDCAADLNGDGIVDGADVGVMLGEWG